MKNKTLIDTTPVVIIGLVLVGAMRLLTLVHLGHVSLLFITIVVFLYGAVIEAAHRESNYLGLATSGIMGFLFAPFVGLWSALPATAAYAAYLASRNRLFPYHFTGTVPFRILAWYVARMGFGKAKRLPSWVLVLITFFADRSLKGALPSGDALQRMSYRSRNAFYDNIVRLLEEEGLSHPSNENIKRVSAAYGRIADSIESHKREAHERAENHV